ncbi:MAG: single-stranded DNA-binding protein [Candidatus Omnitrophica bacterium]|nr:single-stranded DNA-binding protein [Candidatus Omnitrophota bacterium]
MASLNKVLLIGNLTRDPELRYTPQGTAVANIGLAVSRKFKDKSGELREEVCFVTVVVWNKMAETCNQYLHKGSPVFVEGRLMMRSWEDKEGKKRTVIEVRAERVQFLGSKGAGTGAGAGAPAEEVTAAPEQSSEAAWLDETQGDMHETTQ